MFFTSSTNFIFASIIKNGFLKCYISHNRGGTKDDLLWEHSYEDGNAEKYYDGSNKFDVEELPSESDFFIYLLLALKNWMCNILTIMLLFYYFIMLFTSLTNLIFASIIINGFHKCYISMIGMGIKNNVLREFLFLILFFKNLGYPFLLPTKCFGNLCFALFSNVFDYVK